MMVTTIAGGRESPKKPAVRVVYGPNGRVKEFSIDGHIIHGLRFYELSDGFKEAAAVTITFLPSEVEIVQERQLDPAA